jgi:phosphate transport system protein
MTDTRAHFHQELEDLQAELLGVVDRATEMVRKAVDAVTTGNEELAREVVAADDEIDAMYLDIHEKWVNLMARQQPMGSDLRRMAVILQLNMTFERMGDQCVNIARTTTYTQGLPRDPKIVQLLREMGELVQPMIRTAVESYVRGDVDEARLLPAMDEPVDEINRNMYRYVIEAGPDPERLEWAIKMMLVSRALERIGDQAVDFAEQAVYLTTGEKTEFGDSLSADDPD